MFTGLVEETGKIGQIKRNGSSLSLEIECAFAPDLEIGESVAVNGACLTVSGKNAGGFTADVTPETFRRTSLSVLESGGKVNLERAMPAGGRFGGHIVQGHVDGTGVFLGASSDGNSVNIKIRVPFGLGKYIVEKGSVCIDGISLTVASLSFGASGAEFSVAVIPHTWKNTALCFKTEGSPVNIECDIIGKYIAHFLEWGENYKGGNVSGIDGENPSGASGTECASMLEEMMRDFKSYH